jgi:hypothetical protein
MLKPPPLLPLQLLLKKLSLLPLNKMLLLLRLPPQPLPNLLPLPLPLPKPMVPRRMPRKSEEYKSCAMFLMHEFNFNYFPSKFFLKTLFYYVI